MCFWVSNGLPAGTASSNGLGAGVDPSIEEEGLDNPVSNGVEVTSPNNEVGGIGTSLVVLNGLGLLDEESGAGGVVVSTVIIPTPAMSVCGRAAASEQHYDHHTP
mmetsp:Transcript_165701/g.293639  ORF Transcript_165701/g.293639 Transcript_165701/m.293639 type:complete len:105 (-) Transcript_165701:12-326(-)